MSDPGADLLDGFRTVTALLGASRPDAATRPAGAADDGQRCPVTVLTGVLGSGKTTVLRRLLEADHGLAITAVVNDLGAVNIDAALLADATPRSGSGPPPRLELTNGCACCSAADDLRAALREVRGATPPPDAIVIEASGAADAVAVAATVEGDDALALDGVVAVIDVDAAAEQLGHPSLGPLLRRQLATAHLVLLAKIDLVSTEQLDHVHDLVAGLAPGRMLLPIADGRVDPGVLLGAALRGIALPPEPRAHVLDVATATVTLPLDRPLDHAGLVAWLERGDHGLIRAKGWVDGRAKGRLELQIVGRRWRLRPATAGGPTDPAAGSQLVLMATDQAPLDRAEQVLWQLSG